MSDDRTKRDPNDRGRVSDEESYELSYLEEKLGVTRDVIKSAIKAVGNDGQKVEDFIKKISKK